jgi:hypothetical protein
VLAFLQKTTIYVQSLLFGVCFFDAVFSAKDELFDVLENELQCLLAPQATVLIIDNQP